DGQSQRSDDRAAAMEGVLDATVDKLDQHFDEVLQGTRTVTGGALGGGAKQQNEEQAEGYGPTQGIQMEGPETHFLCFFSGVGNAPAIYRVLTIGQVLQVVLDVARSGICCHVCL